MAEIAQPEKVFIKWIGEHMPEIKGAGVEMPVPAVYPFARVTMYFTPIREDHVSIVRATVQVDLIDTDRSRGALLASKLATLVTRDMPGYSCEFGDVNRARVQYGPIWRDDFSPSEPGMYVTDYDMLLRQYPS